jgi:transcriptional regulator with XRE-family HTH domain
VGKLPTHPAELPLRQLAHALVHARRDARLSGREVARRLGVHLADVRAWEHGRARPGWEELDQLSELYGDHLAERLREREPVVLDRAAGVLRIGDRVAAFDPSTTDNEAVLRLYLRRVRELRGLRRGATFVLRDDDIAALALVVDVRDAALEDRLVALMGVDQAQAGVLRRRLVAAAAVAIVGTGVAGASFAVVRGGDDRSPVVAAAEEAGSASSERTTVTATAATTTVDGATTTTAAPSATTAPAASAADVTAPPSAAPSTVAPADPAPTATTSAATSADPGDLETSRPTHSPDAVDDVAGDEVLASTTPEADVVDDPAEAPADAPTDDVPPPPVSHDDPAEAFAPPAATSSATADAAPAPLSFDDPVEAFTA